MQLKNKSKNKSLQGVISITSKGVGYVKIENSKDDIEIDYKYLNKALNQDIVEIKLHKKEKDRQKGEVARIISRAKTKFVGILEPADASALAGKEENNLFFLKPDDIKMYTDILIREKMLNHAKIGDKVFGEIIHWENSKKAPEGKILKILGKPGDNNTEMLSIAIEKGFEENFPKEVLDEIKKIKEIEIKKEDFIGRKDFRKTLTFTIDPIDAKDFDDAISFKKISNNLFEIGIHIADVTYYVKTGSQIDIEAEKRGTSVYLVDRTIPMLPEILSNDICSLIPNKDRLTMSAVFIMDQNANIKMQWFGRTIIHSKKRFSYEEAENILKKDIKDKNINIDKIEFQKALTILNSLAKKISKKRFENGAISLDQEEVKFILDKNGAPLKVIKKKRGDSNRLIEEFMLLANKKIAELISGKKNIKNENKIFVYRIHDLPSKEKMIDLAFFLKSLGHKVSIKDGIIPSSQINKILENLLEKNEKDTVHKAVIRSMQKAIYSTSNIGHYGLAFPYYTHFTSPIRRYPDMMVHRLLMDYLANINNKEKLQKIDKNKLAIYEEISRKASLQEKKAADAERASIKYKQVEYMSSRIGDNFTGVISGVNEWGIFVEEIETKCEGLIKVRNMKDDFYIFDEKKLELVGQKNKKKFKLGGKVYIKVKSVDLMRKTIDYELL